MDTLLHFTKCWLQPEQHSANQVIEKVTSDRFLHSVLLAKPGGWDEDTTDPYPTHRGPGVCLNYIQDRQAGASKRVSRGPSAAMAPAWGEATQQRRSIRRCHGPSPQDKPMSTAPETTALGPAAKSWLTGCVIHSNPDAKLPSIWVQLEGQLVKAILDSGSTITLA